MISEFKGKKVEDLVRLKNMYNRFMLETNEMIQEYEEEVEATGSEFVQIKIWQLKATNREYVKMIEKIDKEIEHRGGSNV